MLTRLAAPVLGPNLLAALHAHLRGKPCRVFMVDMKVRLRISHDDVFYYPDLMVACDARDTDRYFKRYPRVLIEVLSPDTERTDQREKEMAYFQIPSVQLYLLVEQDKARITLLRRAEAGWQMELLEGKLAVLKLDALNIEIPFERIYERTAAAGAARPTA